MSTSPAGEEKFWPETSENLLRTTGTNEGPSKWMAYLGPTRALLRKYRVPDADIEDLTVQALERLCRKVKLYDPSRGRFRSYYQKILYHLFVDYYQGLRRDKALKEDLRSSAAHRQRPEEPPEQEELLGSAAFEVLLERGRELFEEFIAAQPPKRTERRNAETLWHWVVEGQNQHQLSASLGTTTRTVRNIIQRGAQAFAVWARQRFHPEDFAVLQRAARVLDEGASASETGDTDPEGLRQLFRYISDEKRRVILAVLGRLGEQDREPDDQQTL